MATETEIGKKKLTSLNPLHNDDQNKCFRNGAALSWSDCMFSFIFWQWKVKSSISWENTINNYLSLAYYELSDENDDMANYLVLCLQTDEMVPTPKNMMNESLVEEMENKLLNSMEKFGLTRLELFRKVAVKCENFIVFFRESSFGSDTTQWPKICGDLFYPLPMFSPFGTCFTTVSNLRLVLGMWFIGSNQ